MDEIFVIAEIGHNHQGSIHIAKKLISEAKLAGANAVKFQKRDNKNLFTKNLYNQSYDNTNSYGNTYFYVDPRSFKNLAFSEHLTE